MPSPSTKRTPGTTTKREWFQVTLVDCAGSAIAMWPNDPYFPLIPPRFTYDNESNACPWTLRFHHLTITTVTLPAGMDLNLAIDAAVRDFLKGIRNG